MNRGCIAVGEIKCDSCSHLIEHGERYLLIEEKEDEKSRFCVDCCLSKGYAAYVEEKKGELMLTFFPARLDSREAQKDKI
ncbi:MAG: hypothetical protein FJ006_10365 [Chloroflexi bacterium]|nr:hypothetical protein [Chloroflexota bacterium]MBM3174385.1 hypothetical protein [Chloroflexota bacterium]